MSSKKVTMRATRIIVPEGQGFGQDGSLTQDATAASIPFTLLTSSATLLAMETPNQ
jgi:hypothetical protein